MAEELKRPKDFEPVEDASEMVRYLVEGAKTLAAAIIWTQNQEDLIQTHLTTFNQVERALFAWMPKDFDLKKFIENISKRQSDECFFSVSLPAANLFFKTRFLGHDSTGLKFLTPEKVFKVQRRKNVRFNIPEGHVLKVEFQDILLPDVFHKKRVVDISGGGISFLSAPEDAAIYQTGVIIKSMRMTIRLKQLVFDVEVRHTKPFETYKEKFVRVGVAFKNLNANDSALIAGYVFDESRKYFARFL